jgi:flagellar basal body-associated protein FliL
MWNDHCHRVSTHLQFIIIIIIIIIIILFVGLSTMTAFIFAEVNRNEDSHTKDSAEKLWRPLYLKAVFYFTETTKSKYKFQVNVFI